MPHFLYPKRSTTQSINALLIKRAEAIENRPSELGEMVFEVARRIGDRKLTEQIPEYQMLGWLRIASAYRLSVSTDLRRASIAAAALTMLLKKTPKTEDSLDVRAELNWILDQTLDWLELPLGGDWVRDCLSAAELGELEAYLTGGLKNTSFEREAVLKAIDLQKSTIHAFAVLARLTNFDEKLDLLLKAAEGHGEGADAARSALNYIGLVEDVVSDEIGMLGLIDDLYAVEWAYAVAEAHTLALPRLTQMLGDWPYISSPFLMVGGKGLDRYSQYVLGSCNQMVRGGGGRVVLRDASSYATLAAISVGLMAGNDSERPIDEIGRFHDGQPVFLSARNTERLRVLYRGRSKIGGKEKIKLEVADSGTLHLDDWTSKYMFPSSDPHFRLSKGAVVSSWAKEVRTDVLHFLSRSGGLQGADTAVLLVTPRGKVESHLGSISCRGQPYTSVFGASWITQSGAVEPLLGSLDCRPQFFACSDAETAKDVLLDPPEGIPTWVVVTDGDRQFGRLLDLLRSEDINDVPVLGAVDLAERIDISGQNLCLVEDHQIVPIAGRVRGFGTKDALARALVRQSNHWACNTTVIQVDMPLLDELADAAAVLRDDKDDPMLAFLRSGVRRLLIDAGRIPVPIAPLDDGFRSRAENLARCADMLVQYESAAKDVASILNSIQLDGLSYPNLLDEVILGNLDEREVQFAVVVGSRVAAQSSSRKLKAARTAGQAFAAEDAFLKAPFEHVIVPGWFGAHTMRRLMMTPPGRTTTICLARFQKNWLDVSLEASKRRERVLEHRTLEMVDEIDLSVPNERGGPRWPKLTVPRADIDPKRDCGSEVDEVPVADLSSLANRLRPSSGMDQECLGIPVLLEEPGHYCLLPPNGTVFILPSSRTAKASAESEILKPTSALKSGAIFALIGDEHRDLVDDFADFFLEDAPATRRLANLWRRPFKEALRDSPQVWLRLQERLREAGVYRHEQTFRNWAESRIIAPRDYSAVIPAIAKVSLDSELPNQIEAIVSSISKIYKARAKGAEYLIDEVFRGQFDATRMVLETFILGKSKVIQLHTVAAVGRAITCSRADLNRVRYDLFKHEILEGERADI